jgi:lipoprotein-anchoring transpeptidase ErfK/SrfK
LSAPRTAAGLAAAALCLLAPAAARAADAFAPTSGSSLIARIVRPTLGHRAADGRSPVKVRLRTSAAWAHGPVGLMVLGSRRATSGRLWLRVAVPARPNGSSAWVDRDVVQLVRTRWRLRIRVSTRRLQVLHAGRVVRSARVVVGAPQTPTPRGLFAISERVRQPPGEVIGPWALHLTAYSRVLHSYDGGPGRIALHGRAGGLLADPLGSARSHGCVRMSSRFVSWLARRVRPGVPVEIR